MKVIHIYSAARKGPDMTSKPTRRHHGALVTGGAALSTALIWAVARVAGVELRVDPRNGQPPSVIGVSFAVAVTIIVCLIAWAVRVSLQRLTHRAATIWTALAAITLAGSFLPLFMVEASISTKATLATMHLAVAALLIPMFGRRTS